MESNVIDYVGKADQIKNQQYKDISNNRKLSSNVNLYHNIKGIVNLDRVATKKM